MQHAVSNAMQPSLQGQGPCGHVDVVQRNGTCVSSHEGVAAVHAGQPRRPSFSNGCTPYRSLVQFWDGYLITVRQELSWSVSVREMR
jgi:hypothetical protein